ncbi:Slow green 1 protein [Thalictrum thalictroides]|uniref:Slow green 1 protein n=1 Tax=Thalictrum thalictroides TaxID=46969 RepID=A0A7J6VPV7_THATH|nr:Slow green 1 protein [Thalictrum thalictroides]
MNSMASIHHQSNLNILSINNLLSFSKPISSCLSFNPLSNFKTLTKPLTIKLSTSSSSSLRLSPTQKNPSFQTQNPLTTFLKTTCITLVTTTLFLSRFTKPSIAAPVAQPTIERSTEESFDTDEEKEKTFEEYLESHPDDVKGLKGLMEIKIKTRKFEEAIAIIDRLILLDPLEKEWPLLKAHVYSYGGDVDSAKLGFEEVLANDPLSVEAYHGLVMAASQSDGNELGDVMKRMENAMEKCKKEKKKEDLRDFKLLVAQIRVVEGKYTDALKVYQELVKEEPRDFRPYLCQGIIYTLLGKKDEAEKQFQKYRRLVPKGHPYARYFEDNMIATKIFSQAAENQRMGTKSWEK